VWTDEAYKQLCQRFVLIQVFVLSCFVLFVAAALYEGLKLLRETLIRNEIASQAGKEQPTGIG
jgi:hypothetical protein